MKLTKLGKLAKSQNTLTLYKIGDNVEEWAATASSAFALIGVPYMETAEDLATICDVDDVRKEVMQLRTEMQAGWKLTGGLDLSSTAPGDSPAEKVRIRLVVHGTTLTALLAEDGRLGFVDEKLLEPIRDRLGGSYIRWVQRPTGLHDWCYIIKDGFDVIAALMPYPVERADLAEVLQDMADRMRGQKE